MKTLRQSVFEYLDSLPECNLSGWQLHDEMLARTGEHHYPETILKSCRVYADISGASFTCVDKQRSIYHFITGCKIAGAIME